MLSGGVQPVRTVLRALTLSHLHEGKSASEVAALVRLTPKAVRQIGRRYEQAGLEPALYDKPRPGAAPVLDNSQRSASSPWCAATLRRAAHGGPCGG